MLSSLESNKKSSISIDPCPKIPETAQALFRSEPESRKVFLFQNRHFARGTEAPSCTSDIAKSGTHELLLQFLKNPATNQEEINARREIIKGLLAAPCGIYAIDRDLSNMSIARSQYYKIQEERGPIEKEAASLENLRTATIALVKNLQACPNLHLQNLAQQATEALRDFLFNDIASCLSHLSQHVGEDRKVLHDAIDLIAQVADYTSLFCTVARIVKRDNYAEVSFKEDKPEQYCGGWNGLYLKSGDSGFSSWRSKPWSQVLNDSPGDSAIVILSGSQMSGKSFQLEKDLYMHLWAQTFGFIPATSGNLRIYSHFAYFDRATSHSEAGLSAFGTEIAQWKNYIAALPPKGLGKAFADETGSTTAWEDQFGLLCGLSSWCERSGVKLEVATHSESFIARMAKEPNVALHYLGIRIEGNVVSFTHKLECGIDTSHAIEVARALDFDKQITARAEEISRGPVLPYAAKAISFSPIHSYTTEQRENLKRISMGTRLWDLGANELIPNDSKYRNSPLQWETPTEYDAFHPTRTQCEDPFCLRLSSDEDLWRSERLVALDQANKNRNPFSSNNPYSETLRILANGPAISIEEILERQKFFSELLKNDSLERAFELLEKLEHSTWHLQFIAREHSGLINECLNETGKKVTERSWDLSYSIPKLLESCRFVEALSENESDKAIFTDLFDAFDKVWKFSRDLNIPWQDNSTDGRLMRTKELYEQCEQLATELKLTMPIVASEEKKLHAIFDFSQQAVRSYADKLTTHAMACQTNIDLLTVSPDRFKTAALAGALKRFAGHHNAVESISVLFQESEFTAPLLSFLQNFESSLPHRLANYYRNILGVYFEHAENGPKLRAALRSDSKEVRESLANRGPLWHQIDIELKCFRILLNLARDIRDKGFCPVQFNDSGELRIDGAFSLNIDPTTQVRNDYYFNEQQRIQLSLGPNMSGKTSGNKQLFWCLNFAHVTGFAPASAMTTPKFEQLIYLDRVNNQLDGSLSAFGNDLESWKTTLKHIDNGKLTFLIVDEAYSTTSRQFQHFLSLASTERSAIMGSCYQSIATHSHEFANQMQLLYPEQTQIVHYPIHIKSSGEIEFTFQKTAGHAPSRGIDIAEALGILPEIIERARQEVSAL